LRRRALDSDDPDVREVGEDFLKPIDIRISGVCCAGLAVAGSRLFRASELMTALNLSVVTVSWAVRKSLGVRVTRNLSVTMARAVITELRRVRIQENRRDHGTHTDHGGSGAALDTFEGENIVGNDNAQAVVSRKPSQRVAGSARREVSA
jgi:hypothetical protein